MVGILSDPDGSLMAAIIITCSIKSVVVIALSGFLPLLFLEEWQMDLTAARWIHPLYFLFLGWDGVPGFPPLRPEEAGPFVSSSQISPQW